MSPNKRIMNNKSKDLKNTDPSLHEFIVENRGQTRQAADIIYNNKTKRRSDSWNYFIGKLNESAGTVNERVEEKKIPTLIRDVALWRCRLFLRFISFYFVSILCWWENTRDSSKFPTHLIKLINRFDVRRKSFSLILMRKFIEKNRLKGKHDPNVVAVARSRNFQ